MKNPSPKIGCCGFAGRQAEYYRLFQLVEVQQTFYQPPLPPTAVKWRQAAPADFEFTLKAWQLITHTPSSPTYRRLRQPVDPRRADQYGCFRLTPEVLSAWQRTAEIAHLLQAKVVVFQCPASFRPSRQNLANLRDFFQHIDRQGLQPAWEPRGAWPVEIVTRLCEELGLVHCVDPFAFPPLFGAFQYFRLHGIGGYNYRFTEADLDRLEVWASVKPSYVLFNNLAMKENASRFLFRSRATGMYLATG